MDLYVSRPAEGGHGAGIIVVQEIWGVNGHIRDVADRFARLGYLAVAPDVFHRTAPKFEAPYTEMSGYPHANAMTAEGVRADLTAAHAYVLSQLSEDAPVASVGFCVGGRLAFQANAWLPLAASVSFYGGGIAQSALGLVPELHGPSLLIWGGKDKHITSEHRRQVVDALHAAEKPFVHLLFDQADHGFFCDQRASYDKEAAADAWGLVVKFLDARLVHD